jgi:hypothetical protein
MGVVKTKSQFVGGLFIMIKRQIFRTRRYKGRFLLNSRFLVADILVRGEGRSPD